MSETPAADAAEEFTEELDNDIWADEPSGPSLIGRMLAEVAGTFILVLLGVGTALLMATGDNGTQTVGLAFGTAVIISAVAFGAISGAHLNPAVTIGVWLAGRFPGRDVVPYILAQVIGGLFAGGALFLFISSHPTVDNAKEIYSGASIGFGDHSPSGFGLGVGLAVEAVATALLVLVVLAATSRIANAAVAPFAIGLTLAALVVFAIPFTNAGLNPARATATALFSDSWALTQLWAFWVAPIVGAAIVGLLYRAFAPVEEIEIIETIEVVEA
ncbi:aquaporin [Demequina sp.]|uniref:aquaporin n=1 Tax=Demequina sp. TaxID=2050685 RepID=UPI003D0994C7